MKPDVRIVSKHGQKDHLSPGRKLQEEEEKQTVGRENIQIRRTSAEWFRYKKGLPSLYPVRCKKKRNIGEVSTN